MNLELETSYAMFCLFFCSCMCDQPETKSVEGTQIHSAYSAAVKCRAFMCSRAVFDVHSLTLTYCSRLHRCTDIGII